jgi:hypothetical protein
MLVVLTISKIAPLHARSRVCNALKHLALEQFNQAAAYRNEFRRITSDASECSASFLPVFFDLSLYSWVIELIDPNNRLYAQA